MAKTKTAAKKTAAKTTDFSEVNTPVSSEEKKSSKKPQLSQIEKMQIDNYNNSVSFRENN